MTSKHTPGPWMAEKDMLRSLCEGAEGDRLPDWIVCQGQDHVAYVARCYDADRMLGIEAANARLIAAAPDLLDALEEISGAVSSLNTHAERRGGDDVCVQRKEWVDWMINDILHSARAAIAKAKGGPS